MYLFPNKSIMFLDDMFLHKYTLKEGGWSDFKSNRSCNNLLKKHCCTWTETLRNILTEKYKIPKSPSPIPLFNSTPQENHIALDKFNAVSSLFDWANR